MRVADVMSTRVRTVSRGEAADAAWEQMRLHRIRHLVVKHEGWVVGILSDRDLGGRHGKPLRAGRQVADLMTRKVIAVAPRTTVREAANLMRGNVVDCLPVLDAQQLKGIVTALDLLELIGRGVERPVATTKRVILKHRGQRPHAQRAAKHASKATARVTR